MKGRRAGSGAGSRGPGSHGNKLLRRTRCSPASPLRAGTPAVGAPARSPAAQHPAAGAHPGAWESSPGLKEATGRGRGRPDRWAHPSIHHLLAHPSPVQAARLLQLVPGSCYLPCSPEQRQCLPEKGSGCPSLDIVFSLVPCA